jgi:mono/diheme cytochrome c family protein
MFPWGHEDRRRVLAASLLAASLAAVPSVARAQDVPLDQSHLKESPEAAIVRGTLVFRNYCTLCHGLNADGQGRAALMYNPKPANLRMSIANDAYKERIIRKGGKALERSEFMPPWGDELTNEQITDVVRYLRSIAPPNSPK